MKKLGDTVHIRDERPEDFGAVIDLTQRAFAPMPFAAGDEQALMGKLRDVGALTISLVAELDGRVAGHAAFSPAFAKDGSQGWFALGPISVEPGLQRRGIGGRLIGEGLARLRRMDAAGCIVLGDLAYYPRFGFRPFPQFAPEGEPAEYFMILPMGVAAPACVLEFHQAFHEA